MSERRHIVGVFSTPEVGSIQARFTFEFNGKRIILDLSWKSPGVQGQGGRRHLAVKVGFLMLFGKRDVLG